MIQIYYKFPYIKKHKIHLVIKIKMTPPLIQTKTIHLPYLHQILNHSKHKNLHLEIMIHLLFPHNIRLKLLHIFLLNKALLIHMTSAPQIQPTVQFQTKTTNFTNFIVYKLVYPLIFFTPMHYPIILPLETEVDRPFKLFQLIHYHTDLKVQILRVHNIPQQTIINSTLKIPCYIPLVEI